MNILRLLFAFLSLPLHAKNTIAISPHYQEHLVQASCLIFTSSPKPIQYWNPLASHSARDNYHGRWGLAHKHWWRRRLRLIRWSRNNKLPKTFWRYLLRQSEQKEACSNDWYWTSHLFEWQTRKQTVWQTEFDRRCRRRRSVQLLDACVLHFPLHTFSNIVHEILLIPEF